MHIVLVRNRSDINEALQRIQGDPLRNGLAAQGVKVSVVNLIENTVLTERPTHLVYHYNDNEAARSVAVARQREALKIICLCSDIYDLQQYRNLNEITDIFLAPTVWHQKIIQSAITKPVFLLPEGIDSIALPNDGAVLPVAADNKICWFGYPESFHKSLAFVLPEAFAKSEFKPDKFEIITQDNAKLMNLVRHRPFSSKTFYNDTKYYSYSLLSHFAFDLHLNSIIKSPNKIITSIVRGMMPIASLTPSYEDIARKYDLLTLFYGSSTDLSELFKNLDSDRDRIKYGIKNIREQIMRDYSPEVIAKIFMNFAE